MSERIEQNGTNIFKNDVANINDPYQEPFPNIIECLSKATSECCSQKTLKKRLPIIQWLPHYDKSTFLFDLVAGISVALTLIPQGIAFAIIAGISPHYGLYSCFMGSFCYAILGSCKDVTVGPTAIMALLTFSPVHQFNADFAFLGTFLTGCIIFIFGALNLGFLIQFISMPIISGFVTAGVITIGSSQVKLLLGIKSGASGDFLTSCLTIYKHIDEIRYMDTILGLTSLVLLFVLKQPTCLSRWPNVVKYLTISRNALVVILGIIVSYLFYMNDMHPFELAGAIAEGIPEFQLPPFETEINGQQYKFFDMVQGLGLWLFMSPLVSIIESIAISKTFSKGKVVDVTQEIMALGLCNVASSFFRSLPLSGALLRSAINHNSGVKTTFGGVITGCIVLLALSVLSKAFYFIPKTSLGAVMISAVFSMLNIPEIIEIYKTKRVDILPFLSTFLISLFFGLEYGILIGILINILMTLYSASRPNIDFEVEKIDNNDVLIITPDRSVNYSSAEYFKSAVNRKSDNEIPRC
ncbi:hypothetical protein PVAND_003140 [Polypedilum vanderplanki]|uniref:SLC26A/SulP transporter domain-containing protein n=1 Tax=Polypedilum vanderplanki TaxID=319348 RepID=A0A9J6BT48_POLVA|nr:hypothetical protein PVAND_003140 [Polypedilum vanderplanki]